MKLSLITFFKYRSIAKKRKEKKRKETKVAMKWSKDSDCMDARA